METTGQQTATSGGAAANAASTQTASTQTQTTQQSGTQSWTTSLSEDLRGFVQTKGFAEPKDVVESYRNLEKLHGVPKERLLQLPEKLDGPEARTVWERLGAPKEAKEYKFDVSKEVVDEKFLTWAQETFHKLNMPRQMAEGFIKELAAKDAQEITASKEAIQAKVNEEKNALQKDWGSAYEQNKNIADQAIRKFGMSAEEVKALGGSLGLVKAMKFLHKLGEGTGELGYVGEGGGGSGNQMTPDQARTSIKELMKDTDFARRLSAGDTEAKEKWNRLHKFASPGNITV